MNAKTAISTLQEFMVARGHPLPRYEEEGFGTNFKCTVTVEGITAVGHGSSKKIAKHQSAENALKILQSREKQPIQVEDVGAVEKPMKNYVGDLNEYSSRNGLSYPDYEFVTVMVDGKYVFKCNFLEKEITGLGMNKKDAKQIAAKNMLQLIGNECSNNNYIDIKTTSQKYVVPEPEDRIINLFQQISLNKEKPDIQSNNTSPDPLSEKVMVKEEKLEVSEDLKTEEELQQKLKGLNVQFTLETFQKKPYIIVMKIDNTNNTFIGAGNTKGEALLEVYKNALDCTKICSLNSNVTALG